MTTVADLMAELATMPQDLQIVLSSDAEGNSFSPLDKDWSLGTYRDGEFYTEEDDYSDNDVEPATANAIALWPVN
jgi:hypothetical protein